MLHLTRTRVRVSESSYLLSGDQRPFFSPKLSQSLSLDLRELPCDLGGFDLVSSAAAPP